MNVFIPTKSRLIGVPFFRSELAFNVQGDRHSPLSHKVFEKRARFLARL